MKFHRRRWGKLNASIVLDTFVNMKNFPAGVTNGRDLLEWLK